MAKAASAPKLSLTAPETIPLDKLKIHDGNVRQIKAGVSIETLAADIARRGLLQSLSVRPLLDEAGEPTGIYGVQAGGRRLRALQLLVKQKKLAKNAPVPCIVRGEGFVEADSLAENTEREALHPLDQFRAFAALRDRGEGEETIAAAFGVTSAVVRQRLRLAKASPVLLKAYEDEEITLEQLIAFCLTDDLGRQEQVFETIRNHWNKGPDAIRRMITETSAASDDPRAVFVGLDAYEAAGGFVLRDLFDEDEGGWLQDVPLLEKLVAEKLAAEAEKLRAEGWAFVESAVAFPWNHRRDYRALDPVEPALSEAEEAQYRHLQDELDSLRYADQDEMSERDEQRMAAIDKELAALDAKPAVYADEQKAIAGAFVSLNDDGSIRIERGYVKRADERHGNIMIGQAGDETGADGGGDAEGAVPAGHDDDGDGIQLPDRLLTELTAYHSLGLRNAIANDSRIAVLALLHALVLKLFYRFSAESCLQIEARDTLVPPFPGLGEFKAAREIDARHEAFEKMLPQRESDLWDFLARDLDHDSQDALLAHCVGLTVNALHDGASRGSSRRRHALQLAEALALDMGAQGFVTRADNYFSRVTKAHIAEAVTEAKGAGIAALLADMKKKEMAVEAGRLTQDTGWLPEPLRTPSPAEEAPAAILPAFLEEEALQAAE